MNPADPIQPSADTADAKLRALIRERWSPSVPETHVERFIDACTTFGINPDKMARPRELAAVRTGGDPRFLEEEYVVLVTCGGRKIRWPMDAATEERLRYTFKLFKKVRDQRTGEEHLEPLPFPSDLRLPETEKTGRPPERR